MFIPCSRQKKTRPHPTGYSTNEKIVYSSMGNILNGSLFPIHLTIQGMSNIQSLFHTIKRTHTLE